MFKKMFAAMMTMIFCASMIGCGTKTASNVLPENVEDIVTLANGDLTIDKDVEFSVSKDNDGEGLYIYVFDGKGHMLYRITINGSEEYIDGIIDNLT